MDDAHDAEPEPTSYIRLPWAVVAAALAGVLLLALAGGLLANRYLRPQLGAAPAAPAAPAPTAAPVPTPAPTFAAPPTALVQAAAAPSATASPVVAAPTPTSAPGSSPTPSALPTVDPVLADTVGRAYEQFWRILSEALLELDKTHLADVMDGDYLANTEQLIDTLSTEDRAIKTHIVLNYSIVSSSLDTASVLDDEEDNSFYVNIGTEDPQSSPTPDHMRVLYRLKNFSGVWKVVDSVRSQ